MTFKINNIISIIVLLLAAVLTSCDANLILPYKVENRTNNNISLKIKNYPLQNSAYFSKVDTIIELKPKEIVTVAYSNGIGFPWERKKLFKKNSSVHNFEIEPNNLINSIDNKKEHWRYKNGTAYFYIK